MTGTFQTQMRIAALHKTHSNPVDRSPACHQPNFKMKLISSGTSLKMGPQMVLPSANDSFQIRRAAFSVTEQEEDAGLFHSELCQIMVELIPQTRRNGRGDVIIRGFVDRKHEVDVVFAGRRAAQASALEGQLKALLRAARTIAKAADNTPPQIETLRLPVRIEGAWRRAAKRDETGWETSSYHFIAARWSLLDRHGNVVAFGKPVSK